MESRFGEKFDINEWQSIQILLILSMLKAQKLVNSQSRQVSGDIIKICLNLQSNFNLEGKRYFFICVYKGLDYKYFVIKNVQCMKILCYIKTLFLGCKIYMSIAILHC